MSGPDHLVRRFDSIREYVAHAENKRSRANGVDGIHDTSASSELDERGEDGWYQTPDFATATQWCLDGWETVRPTVDAMLEPLRERLADVLDTAPVRIHDLIGGEPDIDRYLSGELECMWDDFHVETPRQGKVLTVLISDVVNAHVDGPTLLKRGTAILALVEAFQILGYDLELWTESSVKHGGWGGQGHSGVKEYSVLCRVHRAGDPLDINTLMFTLANPSWFRRFFFASMEGESKAFREDFGVYPEGWGYGQAADLRCLGLLEPSFVLTKGGESFDRDMDKDPVAWVLKTLEAQGVYNPNREEY